MALALGILVLVAALIVFGASKINTLRGPPRR